MRPIRKWFLAGLAVTLPTVVTAPVMSPARCSP